MIVYAYMNLYVKLNDVILPYCFTIKNNSGCCKCFRRKQAQWTNVDVSQIASVSVTIIALPPSDHNILRRSLEVVWWPSGGEVNTDQQCFCPKIKENAACECKSIYKTMHARQVYPGQTLSLLPNSCSQCRQQVSSSSLISDMFQQRSRSWSATPTSVSKAVESQKLFVSYIEQFLNHGPCMKTIESQKLPNDIEHCQTQAQNESGRKKDWKML